MQRVPPPPYSAGPNTLDQYAQQQQQAHHRGAAAGWGDHRAGVAGRDRVPASKVSDAAVKKELNRKLQVTDDSNRQEIEQMADYYAIVRTMEKLEMSYIRGSIPPNVYEKECQVLIPRFTTLKECMGPDMQNPATAIPTFMTKYNIKAPRAANRFSSGVPATVSAGGGEDAGKMALFVAEAVQGFITLMDSLRLGMTAVDQVHPLTADVVNALNKIAQLPPDFEPKAKAKSWLQILGTMRAADVLDEEQTRQFLLDLESSHQQFVHWLSVDK